MVQKRTNNLVNRKKNYELTKKKLLSKLAQSQGDKTICLIGIMRNESKNVERLLNSLYSKKLGTYIMDMISIVDTGSTDNTKELIENWGKEHNIPTVVHYEPFINFAYNRTHSFTSARMAFPNADYFLLTDADFVWEVDNDIFDKNLLIDHKYLIKQYNKNLSYWNTRLLNAKVDFECVGVTHEYWQECKKNQSYKGTIRTSKINTLRINDQEDGGCKENKFTRDEMLLRQGLIDETDKGLLARYKFYLAQTLKDTRRYAEAIEWYKKRVDDKGWQEEVYYAKYQIGYCYEQMGWHVRHVTTLNRKPKDELTEDEIEHIKKWNPEQYDDSKLKNIYDEHFHQAGIHYLSAYTYRKTRAEALYHLTRMYRCLSMNELAYKYSIIGNKIPYPEQDTLFIEDGCYNYLFDFEQSIVCFYIDKYKDEGRKITKKLLDNPNLPPHIRNTVENNSRKYI